MENSISKHKLRRVENELRSNWDKYRIMPLEEIRAKLIYKLRQETQNENEQLSHKEFYEIIKNIMDENKNKDKNKNKNKNKKVDNNYNKKRFKKDIDNNKDEER